MFTRLALAVTLVAPLALGTSNDDESEFVFVSASAFLAARIAANEAAAISTLRSVASSQAMVQSAAIIDVDDDMNGEYAYFGELAGTVPIRTAPRYPRELIRPSVLSSDFGKLTRTGNVLRSGYAFRMYLPGATLKGKMPGLPESGHGGQGASAATNADNGEIYWSCYAWPIKAGDTGKRAFFLNQEGDMLVADNADGAYSGESHAPAFDAAIDARHPSNMAHPSVPGLMCNDGHVWNMLDERDRINHPPVVLGPATQADLGSGLQPGSDRIALPRKQLVQLTIHSNEGATLSTMRAIAAAQTQLQSVGIIDVDGDSVGEFGYLAELAGVATSRMSLAPKSPAPTFLPASFGTLTSSGALSRNGYLFRMYLPGASAALKVPGLGEPPGGVVAQTGPKPDPNRAEKQWLIYAWPIEAGKTGQTVFFCNQDWDVLMTSNLDCAYSGEGHGPAFDAALSAENSADMDSRIARESRANDTKTWR